MSCARAPARFLPGGFTGVLAPGLGVTADEPPCSRKTGRTGLHGVALSGLGCALAYPGPCTTVEARRLPVAVSAVVAST